MSLVGPARVAMPRRATSTGAACFWKSRHQGRATGHQDLWEHSGLGPLVQTSAPEGWSPRHPPTSLGRPGPCSPLSKARGTLRSPGEEAEAQGRTGLSRSPAGPLHRARGPGSKCGMLRSGMDIKGEALVP